MPRCYSGDLRERVIEAVEKGASRREAAEHFDVSVSSAIKWLQRWHESKSAAPKPRGGSVSPLEEFAAQILALVAEQPDLTLLEIVAKLRKQRIRTSRSSLWRFLDRHDITLEKKACKPPSGSAPMWPAPADAGCGRRACLIPPDWCLSTRPRSAPTWCGCAASVPRQLGQLSFALATRLHGPARLRDVLCGEMGIGSRFTSSR